MTRRKGVFWLVIATALSSEIVKRLLSHEYGPFDRFLEISVVLLILYEIVSPHALIRRAMRRRRLRRINAKLRDLIASGERTKNAIKNWVDYYDREWMDAAKLWIVEVERYLTAQSSEKAVIEFRRTAHLDNQHRKHIAADGRIEWVTGPLGDMFQQLNLQLDNLHRIAVRCEDYF